IDALDVEIKRGLNMLGHKEKLVKPIRERIEKDRPEWDEMSWTEHSREDYMPFGQSYMEEFMKLTSLPLSSVETLFDVSFPKGNKVPNLEETVKIELNNL